MLNSGNSETATAVETVKTCVSIKQRTSLFFNLWSHFQSRICLLNDRMFNKSINRMLLFGSFPSSTINKLSERIQLYSSMVYGFAFMVATLTDPVICKPSKDVTVRKMLHIFFRLLNFSEDVNQN